MENIIEQLKNVAHNYIEGHLEEAAPYKESWQGRGEKGDARLILFWKDGKQLQDIMRLCFEHGIVIQPRGGGTSLNDGARPPRECEDNRLKVVVKSLNKTLYVNQEDNTVLVGAAVTPYELTEYLAAKQLEVRGADIGAFQSCEFGGMFVTNTGGNTVYAHGHINDSVLGIRAVNARGEKIEQLQPLLKNNAGLHLAKFLASLNFPVVVISDLLLRTYPLTRQRQAVLVAVSDVQAAWQMRTYIEQELSDLLIACEYMDDHAIQLVKKHCPDLHNPLLDHAPVTLLLEFSCASQHIPLNDIVEKVFIEAGQRKLVEMEDIIISQSQRQYEELRMVRHHITLAIGREAAENNQSIYGFDLSIPGSQLLKVLKELEYLRITLLPRIKTVCFGHFLDNGMHSNALIPKETDPAHIKAYQEAVYRCVVEHGGSITAEHGLGRNLVACFKTFFPQHYHLMHRLKQLFDPDYLIAPGVGLEGPYYDDA